MKVLIIGNAGSIHIRRWASSLVAKEVEVSVLSPRQVPIDGVRCIPAEVPRWAPWKPRLWSERRRALFRQVLRRVKPDLVHVHYLGPYSVFPEELDGVPLVVNTWGSDVILLEPEPAEQRARKLAILRAADRVVASSYHLACATCDYSGLPKDWVTADHWGVDLNQFRPSAHPTGEPVIGFVKALQPHYGPDVLLRAFASVRKAIPDARLLMAGRGAEEESLKQLAAELGVARHVEWLGQVAHGDVPTLFARMSVFAMPSTHEALGVAALESQAMAVPVVATNIGGIPEIVENGRTGFLVPPGDPEALADRIIAVLRSGELRQRLGRQGRLHVESRFDWRGSVDRMVARYEELASAATVAR